MITVQSNAIQSEKSIQCPIIRQDFFIFNIRVVDNYIDMKNKEIEAFNEERTPEQKKKQPIRPSHRALFLTVLKEARKQLEFRAKMVLNSGTMLPCPVSANEPIKFSTNNRFLALATAPSCEHVKSTIYRQLTRLKEYGFFSKVQTPDGRTLSSVFHGTKSDYDLFINPNLLIIFDAANSNYTPAIPSLLNKQSQKAFANKIAKCNVLDNDSSHREKNKIINPNITIQSDSVENQQQTENPVTIPCLNPSQDNSQTPEKRGNGVSYSDGWPGGAANYVNKMWSPSQKRAFWAALEFYQYTLARLYDADPVADNRGLPLEHRTAFGGKLWNGRVVVMAEERRTLYYLMDNYFHQDRSYEGLTRQLVALKTRIEMAKMNLLKKSYYLNGEWFVSPLQYLRKDNQNGFRGTWDWMWKKQDFIIKQERAAKRKDKLNTRINIYIQNPTVDEHNKQLAYIRKNMPYAENEFIKRTTMMSNAVETQVDSAEFVRNLKSELAERFS